MGQRNENSIKNKVINVQGLTKTKAKKVEELVIGKNTETHKKLRDISFNINCIIIDSMRKEKDRKDVMIYKG